MTDAWTVWAVRSALAGATVLLAASLAMMLTRSPARRRALGVAAAWLALAVPLAALAPAWVLLPRWPTPAANDEFLMTNDERMTNVPMTNDEGPPAGADVSTETPIRHSSFVILSSFVIRNSSLLLAVVYAAVAAALVLRLVAGYAALGRLVSRGRPGPTALAGALADLAGGPRRAPRLVLSGALDTPACCGLARPTVLLPEVMAGSEPASLRPVLAHELAHLRRGDPWAVLGLALAGAVYFPLPWAWWLRRRVRLDQEFLADADAAAACGDRAAYASMLLEMSRGRSVPMGAAAAGGSPSELYRRVDMLLNASRSVETAVPRRWSLLSAGGLTAVAAVAAGLGLGTPPSAARADEGKPAVKKDAPADKGDRPADAFDVWAQKMMKMLESQGGFDDKELEKLRDAMARARKQAAEAGRPDIDGLRKELAELRRRVDEMRRNPKAFDELPKAMDKLKMAIVRDPNDLPKAVEEALRREGAVIRKLEAPGSGRLGVRVEKPDPVLADQLDLPKGQGLVVREVVPGSAAAKAGLKANDILLDVDDKTVPDDAGEFANMVRGLKEGKHTIVVLRKGRKEKLEGVVLARADESPAMDKARLEIEKALEAIEKAEKKGLDDVLIERKRAIAEQIEAAQKERGAVEKAARELLDRTVIDQKRRAAEAIEKAREAAKKAEAIGQKRRAAEEETGRKFRVIIASPKEGVKKGEEAADEGYFTLKRKIDGVAVTVKGRIQGTGRSLESITVADGDSSTTYTQKDFDTMPKKYLSMAREMLVDLK
jgi:beta-lactamase regulating signal transducer with metallopeptidase domain